MKRNSIFVHSYFLKLAFILAFALVLPSRLRAGSVERLVYYDAFGTVSNFTSLAKFPNQPNWSEQLDDFNTPNYGLQSKADGQFYPTIFGSYTRGYLEAPASGNFNFYIASYSGSELWLSTNHLTDGKKLIAYETNQGAALFTGARLNTRRSAPISLVKGQKYYLEVLHQGNSASNSFLQVGWQRPDGVQEILPARHLAQYPEDPRAGTSHAAPFLNTYGLNGGDLPATIAASEGEPLFLESDVIAAQPTTFSWYRNDKLLSGENLSFLSFSPLRAADDKASFRFVVSNAFGSITSSPAILSVTPDKTAPAVALVETRGNPNGLRIDFTEPVRPPTATNISNYILRDANGSVLPISLATVSIDQKSVQLTGAFGFQSSKTYQLTVSGIQDQATIPNTLAPNPTTIAFTHQAALGTLYTFDDGLTNGFKLNGAAVLAPGDGQNSSGYVRLTDAIPYQKGGILFSNVSTVDQFRLKFRTRIADDGGRAGSGFSINLAADLPLDVFINQQQGYQPHADPNGSRLVVSFDNEHNYNGSAQPAISVLWQGVSLTNVAAGVGGVPPINSSDGHWADVDLELRRGGLLNLSYDGVSVLTGLATGYFPVQNARLELAAQTSANYETHWFDDISISYTDGDTGPAGFASKPALSNLTVAENQTARLSVVAAGAAPFTYKWYFNGILIADAVDSFLSFTATPATAGKYSVVVSNEFSSAESEKAVLTVVPDTTAPVLQSARVLSSANNQVVLSFNKPLDPASAINTSTYNLGLLALYSASLGADGKTVILSTGTLERNQVYLFGINGLKDRSVAGNPLTTTGSFVTTQADSVDYASQVILDGAARDWRLNEKAGSITTSSTTTGLDPYTAGIVTFSGAPKLGAASLVPAAPLDGAIQLTKATGDYLSVPNGVDINAYTDPVAKKSVELWFYANSFPAPGAANLNAASTLFEEGGGNRGLALYLYRDPLMINPEVARLVFHAWNNLSDGSGSPWGATASASVGLPSATTPVYVQTTVQSGQTYHVVAVLDGDSKGTNGQLILYVNGQQVDVAGGAGQLYAHTSNVQIGRGTTLLHTGDSGTTATFDGILDDISLYNSALTEETVALHYQSGRNIAAPTAEPLKVSRVDTLENPNQVLVTFNKVVAKNTATNAANYVLRSASGAQLTITNATLLAGDITVRLQGAFGFQVDASYGLTVSNIADQSAPAGIIQPNPTTIGFGFSAPSGVTYAFNNGLPAGVRTYGNAALKSTGNGAEYLALTDASPNQNGAVLFTDRHDITQARIRFKTRISDGTSNGSGFSVNIGPDLPSGTFASPEAGYLAEPSTNRLTVSFNNRNSNPPSISAYWRGVKLTNVLAGVGNVPALSNGDGHWTDVDINLQLSGLLSVSYDGAIVFTNLQTGFQPIIGGQVGFAAGTTASSYETHWFEDINLNFADGGIGPVSISAAGQPRSTVVLENQQATLSVIPSGATPFGYQWFFGTNALAGATNRTLSFIVTTNTTGSYKVVVRNGFSSAASTTATVTAQYDLNPPAVTSIAGYGGGVNQVNIQFNKPLDPATATNLRTYAIDNLQVIGARLDSSGTRVTLSTSQQRNLQSNVLTITGLLDYAAQPHELNTHVGFRSGISFYQEALLDNPVRYYRLDETNGNKANTDLTVVDTLAVAQGVTQNGVILGVPSLFPNSTGTAFQFVKGKTNFIQFQAKQWDVVGTNTGNSSGLQFTNHTAEFWFKANSLPYAQTYTDANGNPAVTNRAYALWSEGANQRYFVVYLYGTDTTTTNPGEATLYLNAGNIANDGPGAYQQWGTLAGGADYAVKVSTIVTTGVVYHVVAQLEGRADSSDGHPIGSLHLYTNGVLAGDSDLPAGILYSHAGTNIRVGQGATNYRHDGYQFGAETFDGVIDDIVIYNELLSSERIAQHYEAGLTSPLPPVVPAAPPVFESIANVGGNLVITWSGTGQLQRATSINGPFTDISGAKSPYREPIADGHVFFRFVQ